jgi:hypothetical protein
VALPEDARTPLLSPGLVALEDAPAEKGDERRFSTFLF